MFLEAKKTLLLRERAQLKLKQLIERQCDWDDPADKALWRHQRRAAWRAKQVMKFGGVGRLCPCCGRSKPNLRSWVITTRIAVCRSCWYRARDETKAKQHQAKNTYHIALFPKTYETAGHPALMLEAKVFRKARRMTRRSQVVFGAKLGVSGVQIHTWEKEDTVLSRERIAQIVEVFKGFGVEILDFEP